ncbi:hypothetical protein ACILDT_09880 [Capnocytophaga canis]|uniref:hypothetical protein n=1 Tax=Capnocytophaga canis TaxID=1848903 RepID=UPI00370D9D62
MKTNKLNSKTIVESVAFSGAAFAGGAVSRVLHDKIPLKDEDGKNTKSMIKRGGIALAGLALAAFIKGDSTTGKALQGVGAGMAATQINDLVKDLMKPKEGVMKTALGSADTVYIAPSYDYYPYEDVNPYGAEEKPLFLSGTTADIFAAS